MTYWIYRHYGCDVTVLLLLCWAWWYSIVDFFFFLQNFVRTVRTWHTNSSLFTEETVELSRFHREMRPAASHSWTWAAVTLRSSAEPTCYPQSCCFACVCFLSLAVPGAADSTCRTQCQCWSNAWTCDPLCVFLLGWSEGWPTEILYCVHKHNGSAALGRKRTRKEHFI